MRIVANPDFDEDVEIVISDNCSTDKTEQVGRAFATKYSNIKYYRNDTNIRDKNFWLVLNEAHGKYRKLQNDYMSFADDGLHVMKSYLQKHPQENIFFTGGFLFTCPEFSEVSCANINEYLYYVSTFVTQISLFGIWENDIPKIVDPMRDSSRMLVQVDWTFQLLTQKPHSVIVNKKVYQAVLAPSTKAPSSVKYNWFSVHVKNYYDIMERYLSKNNDNDEYNFINGKTLRKDKDNCLKHFKTELIFTYVYCPSHFKFKTEGTTEILREYMSHCPRLYWYILQWPFLFLYIPRLYYKYEPTKLRRWIERNFKRKRR